MLANIVAPILKDIEYLTPSAPYPATPSGILPYQKTIYRYSIPTDEQPILTIKDYIPDYNGNFIKPGHYQLALSNDKEFLYIIESKDLIAVVPVFKLEENKSEVKKIYQKKQKKNIKTVFNNFLEKEKKQIKEKIEQKYARTGATKPQDFEYSNATIEYVKDKKYYLLKYEKGYIRAWGAIKVN